MRLANDICRCHDEQCELNSTCLRFLQRKTCGDRTPHVMSHRTDDGCAYYFNPLPLPAKPSSTVECPEPMGKLKEGVLNHDQP